MKLCIAIFVAVVACLSESVNGGESEVIRVFDKHRNMCNEEMLRYLKKAELERLGFKKTVEVATETDENGKKTNKTTIYYLVTDHCSRARFWEGVLEHHLPEEFRSLKLTSKIMKEIESRIKGRKTKSCTLGLEIHLLPGSNEARNKRNVARDSLPRSHKCCCCGGINYD
ncbi:uncharacterized protein LOC114525074 [Dendronephthya gigantea]|uniref:uncharacterized protein LOC114525074 n=1 Tax=Dendronephthya gigantea TaxID=151771 RepID=UPI00106A5E9C|nr:uncharacterized protein LOC114525074 [Dendronephthya gigantea]